MVEIIVFVHRQFAQALPFAGKLVLLCWLAASVGQAQTESAALTGETGHTAIRPPAGALSSLASAADASVSARQESANLLTTFPIFSIQPPAGVGKITPEPQRAYVLPAFTMKALGFPIQQPADLGTGMKEASAALQQASATQSSDRVKQLLNDGYQALNRQDYPAAIASFRQATELEPKNEKIWFEDAYALSHFKQFAEATDALHRVVQLDPVNVAARSQLGYLLIQQDRIQEAIEAFLTAELLDPGNYSFKLQLGYLYDRVNDKQSARTKFIQASESSDLDIHQKAVDALKALAPLVYSRRWLWTNEIYAAPTYYQRFNNLVAPFLWRSGLILAEHQGVEGYISVRATRDTRSSGGNLPQIFEDSFVVTSVGVRARPLKNALTVYGEAGLAFNLLPNRSATVRVRNDFRFGTYFSRQWGKRTPNEKLYFPFNPIGEVYFDVSYYSRFRHNVIGYLQVREGVRILQAQQASLEAYGRVNLVKDSGRDFFNNLVEAGFGVGFVPRQKWGIKLTAEYMRGFYFGLQRRGEPNPYGPRYGDFRLALIYGKYIVKE